MAATTNRPRVFLDISIGEEPAGRLTIELFSDYTPKTCENFRQLCTGEHDELSYAKVPFHRVIDEFMVQGGDIAKGDGTGITSIYGGAFEDEHLDWREMDAAGLVCSANRGSDTNGSQFFITLEPCPHLSGKHTIFGRLVSGEETLERIAKVAVDKNDMPTEPVLISRCGELGKKQKQKQKHDSVRDIQALESPGDDRGRRRKSDISDNEMDTGTTPPRTGRRSRRQSDSVIDEGLRGRPRARSSSQSASKAIEEEDESSDTSATTLHKRKRSPSPSRHMDRREEHADDTERRRRSLPNQYRDRNGDTDRYRPSPRRDDHRHAGRRDNNRYRPSRDHHPDTGRLDHDGRLGGGGYDSSQPDTPVKFKGRGVMKYRENDRAW